MALTRSTSPGRGPKVSRLSAWSIRWSLGISRANRRLLPRPSCARINRKAGEGRHERQDGRRDSDPHVPSLLSMNAPAPRKLRVAASRVAFIRSRRAKSYVSANARKSYIDPRRLSC